VSAELIIWETLILKTPLFVVMRPEKSAWWFSRPVSSDLRALYVGTRTLDHTHHVSQEALRGLLYSLRLLL
jgi:hypothetical protein